MKIKFYKVLSYWREGKDADFDKASMYDSDIFELFKNKLETKERIVKNGRRDLFIFKQNLGTSDFIERPIVLVAGLYAEKQFLDADRIYTLIQDQVDVFDDNKEYLIEVDDDLIATKSKMVKSDTGEKHKLIIGLVIVLGLLSFGVYRLILSPTQNKQDQKITISKKYKPNIDRTIAKEQLSSKKMKKEYTPQVLKSKKIIHEKPKKLPPKWDTFCKNYKIKGSGYCYEGYIQEKCKKKNSFQLSYKEYAKQHRDIRSCRFDGEDENLKEARKENRSIPKAFFKGEKR